MKIVLDKNKTKQKIVENLLYHYDNKYGTTVYYQTRTEPTDCSLSGFYLEENTHIIGGAIFYQAWDWLFIDTVAIDEDYQHVGLGTKLFHAIEEHAKNNKLVGIKLSTMDFQARGFYEKMGFHVICQIENCPRGNTKYELVKYLE